jgi:5-methylcytosine-specific restriction endonuclease McrA
MIRPWQHLYNDRRWASLRRAQLEKQPLCERCLQDGAITVATIVHHVTAHKGNEPLFFDRDNLASSCKRCHDSTEQSIERRGYDRSVSDDGWPQDANHPFNRKHS